MNKKSQSEFRGSYAWSLREFAPARGYPSGEMLYYECGRCGDLVGSFGQDFDECSCGNIAVDAEAGRMAVRESTMVRMFVRTPRIGK
jgi:hypothetical protein